MSQETIAAEIPPGAVEIRTGAPAGNLPIALSMNGTSTPADAYIAIQP